MGGQAAGEGFFRTVEEIFPGQKQIPVAPASREPRVQEAAQAVGRAPGHQVVEAVDGVGGQGRVLGPALPGQVHEANQCFRGLGRQPGLAGFQLIQNGFELVVCIALDRKSVV